MGSCLFKRGIFFAREAVPHREDPDVGGEFIWRVDVGLYGCTKERKNSIGEADFLIP